MPKDVVKNKAVFYAEQLQGDWSLHDTHNNKWNGRLTRSLTERTKKRDSYEETSWCQANLNIGNTLPLQKESTLIRSC